MTFGGDERRVVDVGSGIAGGLDGRRKTEMGLVVMSDDLRDAAARVYAAPGDEDLAAIMRRAAALGIPAWRVAAALGVPLAVAAGRQ